MSTLGVCYTDPLTTRPPGSAPLPTTRPPDQPPTTPRYQSPHAPSDPYLPTTGPLPNPLHRHCPTDRVRQPAATLHFRFRLYPLRHIREQVLVVILVNLKNGLKQKEFFLILRISGDKGNQKKKTRGYWGKSEVSPHFGRRSFLILGTSGIKIIKTRDYKLTYGP